MRIIKLLLVSAAIWFVATNVDGVLAIALCGIALPAFFWAIGWTTDDGLAFWEDPEKAHKERVEKMLARTRAEIDARKGQH